MKLVTGTYSFFIHAVSAFAPVFFSAVSMLSAFASVMAIRSDVLADRLSAGSSPAIFASSGRPLKVCLLSNCSSSNSLPSRRAFLLARSFSRRASFSFIDSMANLRAFISSSLIFTFRLKPMLYRWVRNMCRLSLRFQFCSSTVGISLVV